MDGSRGRRGHRIPLPPLPVVEAYKRDVDRASIRKNLALTPEQRIDQLQALVDFMRDLRAAPRRP